MAHNIYRNAAMAYVKGISPWHGLGVELPAASTWGDMRAAVGFYNVIEVPVYAHGSPSVVEGYKALRASDDGRILAIVGADYGVVQFDDMAAAIVEAGSAVGAVFKTAGLLGAKGAKGWIMGELPKLDFEVPGHSEVKANFLAYTGHDGQTSTTLANSDVVTVCQNTVTAALGEASWKHSIRHTSTAADRVKAAAGSFDALIRSKIAFRETALAMARTPCTEEQVSKVIDAIVPAVEEDARNFDRVEADRAKIAELAFNGTGVTPAIQGTAWGAYMGFTEWADHFRMVRAQEQIDQLQAKAYGLTFGPAAEAKGEAFAMLSRMAKQSARV